MAHDIFVSYAREDEARIAQLAGALISSGKLVFWDRRVPAGKTWRNWIGKALQESGCVIVAWTRNSVDSDWVIAEAEEGKRRGVLVPILLDVVDPPLGFRHIQAADLSGCELRTGDAVFDQFVRDVEEALSGSVIRQAPAGEEPRSAEEHARAEDERRRVEEQARLAEQTRAQEERRRAEEQARLADQARAEEERRRAEEQARVADQARAEEKRRRAEEQARLAEQARAEEERRRAEEQARLAEQVRTDEERGRAGEQARVAEQARADDERRRSPEKQEYRQPLARGKFLLAFAVTSIGFILIRWVVVPGGASRKGDTPASGVETATSVVPPAPTPTPPTPTAEQVPRREATPSDVWSPAAGAARDAIVPDVIDVGRNTLSNLAKTRNTGSDFDYWPNGGIQIAYYHLATFASYEALVRLSPYPVFASGPHNSKQLDLASDFTFGHYNPKFLQWFEGHLTEILQDRAFVQSTKKSFRQYLGKTAMTYWATYATLNRHPKELKKLLDDYRTKLHKHALPQGYYYEIAWEGEKHFLSLRELYAAHDVNVVAPAVYFWLRRRIDGTDVKMFAMLESLLRAYEMIH